MSFLFDANLSPALADALKLLSKPVVHVRDISSLGSAAPDDAILDHAAQWGHVLVTRDRALRRSAHFRDLLVAQKLAVIFVNTGAARQLTAWQIAQLVVRGWDNVEAFVSGSKRPLIGVMQRNGRVVAG